MAYFSVPAEGQIRKDWIAKIEQHQEFDYTVRTFPVCGRHFEPAEILRRGKRTTLSQERFQVN